MPPKAKRTKQPSPKPNDNESTSSASTSASAASTTSNTNPNETALLDEEEIPEAPGSEPESIDGTIPGATDPGTTEPAPSIKQHKTSPDGRNTGVYGSGYNALKSFNGQTYSGMSIGGSHTWNYDQGVWKETKEEPDLWKVDYGANKKRARRAPRGSGAPVGTEYHWYIVGHQHVKKLDANTYETHLTGSKYKLAHKGASSNSWSIPTVKGQREREIELLDDAKRRVQGLPPVLAGEKVKVEKREKGQQKLDSLFANVKGGNTGSGEEKKRKRDEVDDTHEE